MTPWLTFYTSTHKRPQALAACLASVWTQTRTDAIEHIVIPDHVGIGIAGVFDRIQHYAHAVHGKYVHVLADDETLVNADVVDDVMTFAQREGNPSLIVVDVEKDGRRLPTRQMWPPVCGHIDLGCLITRADVWRAHVRDYGKRYEGDFDFANAMAAAGVQATFLPLLFLRGRASHGRVEAEQVSA